MSIRANLKTTLAAVGFYRARLLADPFPGVAVLAYHGVRAPGAPASSMCGGGLHVAVERLEEHCRVLRDLCTPISGVRFRELAGGAATAPPCAALVTFDDGYASVLTQALPVLEEYGVPAVVFVCPTPIERQVRFWFDAVAERRGAGAVGELKQLPYLQWREAVGPGMSVERGDPHAPLTIRELQQLAAHPLIEIGAHTMTHPILAQAPLDVQRQEILESRSTLEAWLGAPPSLFAYPNGRPGIDYSDDTRRLVAEGFADGFAVGDAYTDPRARRFEQRRFLMLDSLEGAELAHRLAISWPRAPLPA